MSVPARAVYGDGLVVFTDDAAAPTPGFATAVFTGRVDPAEVRALLASAGASGFFDLRTDVRPGPAPEGADAPEPPLDALVEVLAATAQGRLHEVRLRPAGRSDAPAPFRALRDALLALKPADVRRYWPASFVLRASRLEGEDPARHPALSRGTADLSRAARAPLPLGREAGERIHELMKGANAATLSQGSTVFSVELLAPPPR